MKFHSFRTEERDDDDDDDDDDVICMSFGVVYGESEKEM